ncbi:serine--tRNA ligase, partial [Candidatus Saccharibacteria bacterium]|nr:serine--tRNA ligase [Candidatus Saccharibacteria bacterium]
MLDIQFIRENKGLVKTKAEQKNIKVDLERLLQLDEQRRQLLAEVETLRRRRNELTASAKNTKPNSDQVAQGKTLKDTLSQKDKSLKLIEVDFGQLLDDVPNIFPDDTPLGGEEANQPVKNWGEPRKDKVKDHLDWGETRGLIDFERGAKVAGNKFYFLKGPLVKLELAVFEMALDMTEKQGFIPMIVPNLVKTS